MLRDRLLVRYFVPHRAQTTLVGEHQRTIVAVPNQAGQDEALRSSSAKHREKWALSIGEGRVRARGCASRARGLFWFSMADERVPQEASRVSSRASWEDYFMHIAREVS